MAVENRYQIEVNMKSRMFREVPEVVANDKVIFEITVYDGPQKFPLSASYTYHLTSLKLGGQSVIREGTLSGEVIVFELGTSEMTVPGKVEGTVQIFDENNDRISSSKFDYVVKRDPSLQGSLPADNTSLIIANESLLTSAVEKSDTAIADSSTALTRVEAAETKATAAETTANQVKSEFDQVVAEAGSNNPEVVQARGEFVNLNDRLNATSDQLAEKAAKTEVFTMANMGQDIKTAMTGGSVAVVGENAVNTINVLDKAINTSKIEPTLLDSLGLEPQTLNWVVGQIQSGNINTLATTAASTDNFITLDKDVTITFTGGADKFYGVFYYTLAGAYTGVIKNNNKGNLKLDAATDRKVRISILYDDMRTGVKIPALTQHMSVIKGVKTVGMLDNRLATLENKATIPSYWDSHLTTKINTIKTKQKQLGFNGTSFAFITDIHWNDNAKNSPNLLRKVMEECDIPYYIDGGDIAANPLNVPKATQIAEMKEVKEKFKSLEDRCLRALGNHDDNSINNKYSMTITDKEMYDLMYRQNSKYQKFKSGKTGEYYYADDEMHKIRYIVLNALDIPYVETASDGLQYTGMGTWAFRQEQIDWFADKALNVPNNEWGVVVCSHIPINQGLIKNDSIMMNILQAFKNKSTYTGTNTTDADFLVNKTVDYTGKGGDVICWLAGHYHKDQTVTLPGNITFPEILTLNDSKHVSTGAPTKTVGTTTEHAFDVFTIDKVNRTLTVTRIGAGSDRTFTY